MHRWMERHIDERATLGDAHAPMIFACDVEKTDVSPSMIHNAFSNLQTGLLYPHHPVSQHRRPAYRIEFVFRFNRPFSFNSILGIAAPALAPTYKTPSSGE